MAKHFRCRNETLTKEETSTIDSEIVQIPDSSRMKKILGCWFIFCCLPLIGISGLHAHRPLIVEIPYMESAGLLASNLDLNTIDSLDSTQWTVHPKETVRLLRFFYDSTGARLDILLFANNATFIFASLIVLLILIRSERKCNGLRTQVNFFQSCITKSLFVLGVFSSPILFSHSYAFSVEPIAILFFALFGLFGIQQKEENSYLIRWAFWLAAGVGLSIVHCYGALLVSGMLFGIVLNRFGSLTNRRSFRRSIHKESVYRAIAFTILIYWLLINLKTFEHSLELTQNRYWSQWCHDLATELPFGFLWNRAVGPTLYISNGMCNILQACTFLLLILSMPMSLLRNNPICIFQLTAVSLVLAWRVFEEIGDAPFLILHHFSPFFLLFGISIFSAIQQLFGFRGEISIALVSIFVFLFPTIALLALPQTSNKNILTDAVECIEAESMSKDVLFIGSRTYVLFAPYLSQNARDKAKVFLPRHGDNFLGASLVDKNRIIQGKLPPKLINPTVFITLEYAGSIKVDTNNFTLIQTQTFKHRGPIIGTIGVDSFEANEQ